MSNIRLFDPMFDDDAFDKAMRRFFSPVAFEKEVPTMKMKIDVTENNEGYQVNADVPGVKKEDIHVRVDGNVVRIDAESRREKETKKDDKLLRSERYYGTISRTFSLAQDVDESKVQAKYADGVLSLVLPKKAAPSATKITVQ